MSLLAFGIGAALGTAFGGAIGLDQVLKIKAAAGNASPRQAETCEMIKHSWTKVSDPRFAEKLVCTKCGAVKVTDARRP